MKKKTITAINQKIFIWFNSGKTDEESEKQKRKDFYHLIDLTLLVVKLQFFGLSKQWVKKYSLLPLKNHSNTFCFSLKKFLKIEKRKKK